MSMQTLCPKPPSREVRPRAAVQVVAPGLAASRGQLVAIDAAGAVIDRVTEPTIATAMDFALAKRTVYAVTTEGRLVAVKSDHAAPPAGSWPTPGAGPANRRRAGPR